MVTCNVVVPQLFWSTRLRRHLGVVFAISLLVNVGMWFERFVIIVTSLHRDYLPSSWSSYVPTPIEVATFAGTFGLFLGLFLLFCRFLPVIAMAEVKGVLRWGEPEPHGDATDAAHLALARPLDLPPYGESPEAARARRRWRDTSRRYLLATFVDERQVLRGVGALRRAGHGVRELFAPWAVHGLDEAAGVPRSRLGWVCAGAGLLAAGGMYLFQVWTSATSWPIDVGGKPLVSWPAFVPVVFESGVLVGGLAVVAALLVRCGLWPGRRPRLVPEGATDDRFVVVVEEADAAFDPQRVAALCRRHGAVAVEEQVLETV
jgi:molybdopterin-containing oxidoreductase family membrane subunit